MDLLRNHSFRLGISEIVKATNSFSLVATARIAADDYDLSVSFRDKIEATATTLYAETLASPGCKWQYAPAIDFAYVACAAALFDRIQKNAGSNSLLKKISDGRISGIFEAIWVQKPTGIVGRSQHFDSCIDYMVNTAIHREDFRPHHFKDMFARLALDTKEGIGEAHAVKFSYIVHAARENGQKLSDFVADSNALGIYSAYTNYIPAPHGGFFSATTLSAYSREEAMYHLNSIDMIDTADKIAKVVVNMQSTSEKKALAIVEAVEGFFNHVYAMDVSVRGKAFPNIERQRQEWLNVMREQFASEYVPATPFGHKVMGRLRGYDK